MKVLFLAKQTGASLDVLQYMLKNNVEIIFAVLRDSDKELMKICKAVNIRFGTEEELLDLYAQGKIEADYLISFYWKLVKEETLAIPHRGNINFHPGPLPEARGSGYHVAILENWGYWGVTVHYMDKNFDTGDIIECRRFRIPENIVNKDLVDLTCKQLSCLFHDVMLSLLRGDTLNSEKQKEGNYYSLFELEKAKLISKEDTLEEIDRKIRAFWNPPYSGAQIIINGRNYTLINDMILQWVAERVSSTINLGQEKL